MSFFPECHRQQGHQLRFEWGIVGAEAVAADVNVVVDVLSFTTSVCVAVDRGMVVYPFAWKDERAHEFAAKMDASLAVGRRQVKAAQDGPSLSPAHLARCPFSPRIVLPSPNGSTISELLARSGGQVVAGCLRNAQAVAEYVASKYRDGATIAVVASGEKWRSDQSLRPSLEDQLGAGAILDQLVQRIDQASGFSPEATAAAALHRAVSGQVQPLIQMSASGEELISSGFADDVAHAIEVDVSQAVPIMVNGAFADCNKNHTMNHPDVAESS